MPGQQSTTLGCNAGDCGTCLTLLDMFCKGININGPSIVLTFFGDAALKEAMKRSHSSDETFHFAG